MGTNKIPWIRKVSRDRRNDKILWIWQGWGHRILKVSRNRKSLEYGKDDFCTQTHRQTLHHYIYIIIITMTVASSMAPYPTKLLNKQEVWGLRIEERRTIIKRERWYDNENIGQSDMCLWSLILFWSWCGWRWSCFESPARRGVWERRVYAKIIDEVEILLLAPTKSEWERLGRKEIFVGMIEAPEKNSKALRCNSWGISPQDPFFNLTFPCWQKSS